MPQITLRQAVMLVNHMHLDQPGDVDALMTAAQMFGVQDTHALGGLEEAADNFRRNNKLLAAKLPNIDDMMDGFGGDKEALRGIRKEKLETWIAENQGRLGETLNVTGTGVGGVGSGKQT